MRLNKASKEKLLVAVSALSMLAVTPAWAGFASGNQVTLGGQPVFTIAGSAEGFSPDHRAWLAQDALDNALVRSSDKSPSAVSVSRMNGAVVVTLGGHKVATADSNSASLEGVSAQALADRWAGSIRNFLSHSAKTQDYVATLMGNHPINAQVAVVERRIFAPPGTVLPVAFATTISSETLKAGDTISGTLAQEVAFGNYVLPVNSTVVGIVEERQPGVYSIAFNQLKTPNGTLLPIAANLTGAFITANLGPHLVATESMPYGNKPRYLGQAETACRIPAQIGIGTLGGSTQRLAFRRGSNLIISAGTPMAVIMDQPQQVAVVLKGVQM